MKKISKIILAFLMVGTVFSALAACKEEDTASVELVSAKLNAATVWVGADLGLSKGKLVYTENGETKEIALNGEGVSVSGYDKNKLGEQEVTISYKGEEIKVTVTVVAMVVDNAVTTYFVGDDFNASQGSVKIRQQDGKLKNIPLKDEKISISGFDSTKEGECVVSVLYNDGSQQLTTTFKVNVYAIDEVVLSKKPVDLDYKSYETTLNMEGAFLTLKNGSVTATIPVTNDMVTGFDPTVVSAEEPEKTQTLTIRYGTKTFTFDVTIKYSKVTLFKEIAAEFKDIDWEQEELPEINETLGAKAFDAMDNIYNGLSPEEQAVVTADDKLAVMRAATIYAYDKWMDEVDTFTNTFAVLTDVRGVPYIALTCKDYAETKNDLDRLNDPNSTIYVYSDFLMEYFDQYAEETLYGDTQFQEHVNALYNDSVYESVTHILTYMIELYDILGPDVVPENWTKDTISQYGDAVEAAIAHIKASPYSAYTYDFTNDLVTGWREDLFHIIYAYYYYGSASQQNYISTNLFQKIAMPGKLHTIYANVISGNQLAKDFKTYTSQAIWYDTMTIFEAYHNILTLRTQIKEENDELIMGLYELLDIDFFVEYNLIFIENGYKDLAKELYGDEKFHSLWKAYIDLFDLATGNGFDLQEETTIAGFNNVFEKFMNETPSWQYSFIASMHYKYRESTKYPSLVLDYSQDYVYSNFVYLYANFYAMQLTYKDGEDTVSYKKAQALCQDLFEAIEIYALRYRCDTTEDFIEHMLDMQDDYASLKGAEKDKFDAVLGRYYQKYVVLYNDLVSTASVNLGTYQTTFNEMKDAITLFYELESIVNGASKNDTKLEIYPLLYATYEKIKACGEAILASGNDEIIFAFYHDDYTYNFLYHIDETRTQNDSKTHSLEYGMWKAREVFIAVVVDKVKIQITSGTAVRENRVWDFYTVSDLDKLLLNCYAIMAADYKGESLSSAEILVAMENFRSFITADEANDGTTYRATWLFDKLNCDTRYYAVLTDFVNQITDEATKEFGLELLAAERAYVASIQSSNAETKAEFETAMEDVEIAFNAISDYTEYNAMLKAMYEFYLAKLEA